MALEDVERWVRRADTAVRAVLDGFEQANGYPPDVNEVVRTAVNSASESSWPTAALERFFSVVDEVSWPDVWNGYFVGPGSEMLRQFTAGELNRLEVAAQVRAAFPLGSDGGGAYFVLLVDDETVLRVENAVLSDTLLTGAAHVIASSLDGFLEALVRNAELVAMGKRPDF